MSVRKFTTSLSHRDMSGWVAEYWWSVAVATSTVTYSTVWGSELFPAWHKNNSFRTLSSFWRIWTFCSKTSFSDLNLLTCCWVSFAFARLFSRLFLTAMLFRSRRFWYSSLILSSLVRFAWETSVSESSEKLSPEDGNVCLFLRGIFILFDHNNLLSAAGRQL